MDNRFSERLQTSTGDAPGGALDSNLLRSAEYQQARSLAIGGQLV